MARYGFVTVDVFTDQRFGGNPLAVFPQAEGLSDALMQALTKEFNYSETTFVLPADDPKHTARVRIFTPAGELPFAGHPNVGTAFVLAQHMPDVEELVFEEKAGLVPMRLHRSPDGAVTGATLTAPVPLTIGANIAPEIAAACASLLPSDFPGVPVVAGVGVNQVFAEVTDRAALARASPDPSAFREAKSRVPAIGDHFALHLYVRDPGHPSRIRARMFAPLLGVPEDPATGSANASLAALLVARSGDAEGAFEIEQGVEMGRPSLLRAAAWRESDGSVRARIGGDCVTMLRGSIEL